MHNELIKELREITGAGLLDVKKALEETGWDKESAIKALREMGAVKQLKKSDRVTSQGLVESYIHAGGKIGVLLEVNCETDFVARTDDFKMLVKDLALQIAASNPTYINRDEVPESVLQNEREILTTQAAGKPEDVVQKMVQGRMEKFFEENCLLDQVFVKDSDKKVADLLSEAVGKIGENIKVRRFARFVLGN